MGAILVSAAAGLLLLSPFVRHSLPVLREAGASRTPRCTGLHPYRISWLDMGTGNWVWGWTAGWPLFRPASYVDEHHLGFGLVTLIACAAGLYLGRNRPICRLAGVVGLALCVATTFMPRGSLVLAARAVAFFCVAALFRDVEHPRSRAAGLAILLGFLFLVRFPNAYLQALSLGLIAVCLLEIYRAGAAREARIVAAVALGLVCLKLFAVQVMPTATAFAAAVTAPTAIVLKRRWWALGRVALVAWLLFLVAITYLDRPRMAIGGFAGVGVALAVVKQERLRPPARLMVRALPFALLIIIIYYESDSLWLRIYDGIPGGLGIRAVGRVVLIVLIPAALGLATLVQRLQRNGMQIAGWLLAIGCMVEQAVTTASYDAAVNRARSRRWLAGSTRRARRSIIVPARTGTGSATSSTPCGRLSRAGSPRSTATPATIRGTGTGSSRSRPSVVRDPGTSWTSGSRREASGEIGSSGSVPTVRTAEHRPRNDEMTCSKPHNVMCPDTPKVSMRKSLWGSDSSAP